ncbi:MAG TPA: DNA-binding protein [Mycobacterium sp.]|nr:DNA-binding protein [Mycobacterium sp.]
MPGAARWDGEAERVRFEDLRDKTVLTLEDLRAEEATVSIERAGMYLGVIRARAYAMARDGLLPTIKCGQRRFRVPTSALLEMLDV